MVASNTILVIDDNADIRDLVVDILRDEGYSTKTAYNVESALHELNADLLPKLVILDIWLDGHHMDGIGLLKTIKKMYSNIPILMISGHANIEIAASTIKLGAYDFLEKPFKAERLIISVKRAIESSKLLEANAAMRGQDLEILGASRFALNLREKAKAIANSNSRVLIKGESGVGKDTLAKYLHTFSPRAYNEFITCNPRSLSEEALNKQLFSGNASLIQRADGGTIFFHEILDIPLSIQIKLLEIMQSAKGNDIRFIAATEGDCEAAVQEGRLNNSFYLRIAVQHIEILPLRERQQDIPVLAQHYLTKCNNNFMRKNYTFSDDAIAQMLSYSWPGNLRELHNVINSCAIHYAIAYHNRLEQINLEQGSFTILAEDIRKRIMIQEPNYALDMLNMNYKEAKKLFEKQYLKVIIAKFGGNIARTAQFIGMDRAALHRKIKLLKIRVSNND